MAKRSYLSSPHSNSLLCVEVVIPIQFYSLKFRQTQFYLMQFATKISTTIPMAWLYSPLLTTFVFISGFVYISFKYIIHSRKKLNEDKMSRPVWDLHELAGTVCCSVALRSNTADWLRSGIAGLGEPCVNLYDK